MLVGDLKGWERGNTYYIAEKGKVGGEYEKIKRRKCIRVPEVGI